MQWDGNIGKQSWKNPTEAQRSYTFIYDASKRLKSAAYAGVGAENFSIPNMSYDKNGNIKNLQRFGKVGNGYGLMDNLTYTHNGNRLSQITDAQSSNSANEFVQRGNASYTFWPDGSLKSDANEQIANTSYDIFLKQPREITLTDGRWIKHFYDGGGNLLKTQYSTGDVFEYIGGQVFKNGVLFQVSTPEGRVIHQNGAFKYEFDYKDHLGNTRVSFLANGNQLEKTAETTFDPWGVVLQELGQVNGITNRFEYQNKESEKTFGLNRVNFGARTYNPISGVWDGVDELSEKYFDLSTYTYVANNPIKFIDPDGKRIILSGTQAERKLILQSLQKLTNDQLMLSPKTGVVYIKSYNTSNSGKNLKNGTELIRDLNHKSANSKTVTISIGVKGSGNNETDINSKNAINGIGSDTKVNYDVSANPSILTKNPKTGNVTGQSRPNEIGLGHELIHAQRSMKGVATNYSITNKFNYRDASGNVVSQVIPLEELQTSGLKGNKPNDITENKLRTEQGLNKRGAY